MTTTPLTLERLSRGDADGAPAIPAPRRRWLTRVGLPSAILLITALLLAYAARDVLLPAREVQVVRVIARPVQVSSAQIAAAAGTVVAQAPGWVEPDPFPIHITALTEGIVRETLVLEGDSVTKHQVAARLIDDDAKLAERKAVAEVARRKAALDAAQAQWDNPIDRKRAVAVNKAMKAEAEAEQAQVDATVAVESAKLAELKAAYDRLHGLPAGVAATQDLEQATYRVEAQRAALDAAKKQRAIADAKAARFTAEVEAAERELELRITEKQALADAHAMHDEAVAKHDESKLRLERMEIRSPADGIVMIRYATPGARMMLASDEPHAAYVADLYDPKKLQVRADVPLADAAKIGVGQRAQLIVDVLPDHVFEGKVTRLVHQADIGKNTIQVKVAIENPSPQLKPEMLARVKFLSQAKAADNDEVGGTDKRSPRSLSVEPGTMTALRPFIPAGLVSDDAGRATVWVIEANEAKRRAVTVGAARQDGWIEIVDGLNPGDAVIANADGLSEGQRVRLGAEVE